MALSSALSACASTPKSNSDAATEAKPQLLNRAEIGRLLDEYYPASLKEAGIRGTVILVVRIDEDGNTTRSTVSRSSGHPTLDEAAQRVAAQMIWSPAINLGNKVPVSIVVPVEFASTSGED